MPQSTFPPHLPVYDCGPGSGRGGIALVGLCVLALVFVRLVGNSFSAIAPCIFHAVTGWPCPLCGSTRAFDALARGDLFAALAWNPLVILGALTVFGGTLRKIVHRCRGIPPRPGAHRSRVGASLAVAIAANWLYLLAVGR